VVQKAKEIVNVTIKLSFFPCAHTVLLSRKERVVCYMGAGISTSADIPGIFCKREESGRVGEREEDS
jgi:hypothetical protein